MLLLSCPVCANVVQVSVGVAAQNISCEHCGQFIELPSPASSRTNDRQFKHLDESSVRPHIQRKVQSQRLGNWFTPLGALAFFITSPIAGLQIWYVLVPVVLIFAAIGLYDLQLQRFSRLEIFKGGLGIFFLWPFAYPGYLLRRHDFEGRTLGIQMLLIGGMWFLGVIFVDSWAEWNAWVQSGAAH